jgi:hypothetical protein
LRRLFTAFVSLSLLLCVALVVFWIRSYSGWDIVGRADERIPQKSSSYAVWSGKGSFWLFYEGYDARQRQRQRDSAPGLSWYFSRDADAPSTMIFDPNPTDDGYHFGHQWIAWAHDGSWPNGFFILACPYWIALVVTVLPVSILIVTSRIRRASRLRKGQCISCGYDLAGNVSGVCPECGTAVARKRVAVG